MRILVISPCSKDQIPDIPNKLQPIDFRSCDCLAQGIERLSDYKTPAAKMYVGREQKEIMKGLRKIRKRYERESMELSIVSTGYGLVDECCTIVPYDVPLCKSPVLLEKKSDKLHNDIENLIGNGNYDLVFFLLSGAYYKALRLNKRPFKKEKVPNAIDLIFLVGKSYCHLIPYCLPNYHSIFLNFSEFGGNRIAKGRVFRKLCKTACSEGFGIFEQVKKDPRQLLNIIQNK